MFPQEEDINVAVFLCFWLMYKSSIPELYRKTFFYTIYLIYD